MHRPLCDTLFLIVSLRPVTRKLHVVRISVAATEPYRRMSAQATRVFTIPLGASIACASPAGA